MIDPTMGAQPIPANVAEQAMQSRLGNLHRVYKSNLFATIGIAAAVLIVDLILAVAVLLSTNYFFSIFIYIAIIAIIYMVYALVRGNVHLYEFAQGFIHAKGSNLFVTRWEHIPFVWKESRQRVNYAVGGLIGMLLAGNRAAQIYTIQRQDGAKIKVDTSHIRKLEAFGETLHHEVVQVHLPLAVRALDSGQPVDFGSFQVSQQGIINSKGVILPWPMLQEVKVVNNAVLIIQAGKMLRWASAVQGKVPNLDVFLELVNYARQRAASSLSSAPFNQSR